MACDAGFRGSLHILVPVSDDLLRIPLHQIWTGAVAYKRMLVSTELFVVRVKAEIGFFEAEQ
jgi:hypothetical protein